MDEPTREEADELLGKANSLRILMEAFNNRNNENIEVLSTIRKEIKRLNEILDKYEGE